MELEWDEPLPKHSQVKATRTLEVEHDVSGNPETFKTFMEADN